MKGTQGRRVTRSDEMAEGCVDGRIEECRAGIEFDCCQGEVFVVAIWAASGNRKSVSLAANSRVGVATFAKRGPRKVSGDRQEVDRIKSWSVTVPVCKARRGGTGDGRLGMGWVTRFFGGRCRFFEKCDNAK